MDKEEEARLAVLEYRMDTQDADMKKLALHWADSHKALATALEGIQKNLTAIKWAAVGALAASFVSVMGLADGLKLVKDLLLK